MRMVCPKRNEGGAHTIWGRGLVADMRRPATFSGVTEPRQNARSSHGHSEQTLTGRRVMGNIRRGLRGD